MKKTVKKVGKYVVLGALLVAVSISLVGCTAQMTVGSNYTIPQIDLSAMPSGTDAKYSSLYEQYVVDDGADYMAHPDAALLQDDRIIVMYPEGHGKGRILAKTSTDGKEWSSRLTNLPASFAKSKETPTIYRLKFSDGSEKYVVTSANPDWQVPGSGGGWNASVSNDGLNWSEFEQFYGKDANGKKDVGFVTPIVAMASLTQLKDENGKWKNEWMGFFHDGNFYNYKSILSFNGEGKMQWSQPEKYFAQYRKIEKATAMCEVEVVRSDNGTGDTLCLLTRSNGSNRNKGNNSLISFSKDEGKTWSQPVELPQAVSGERLKADYLQDGRLVITFRSIERDAEKLKSSTEVNGIGKGKWFSEGLIAWVGTFEDLEAGKEGQYRIKLAHTYFGSQSAPAMTANGDTGYCGNVVLPNGDYVTTSYGTFSKDKVSADGKKLKTYILSKRINFDLLDELVSLKFSR